MMELNQSDLPSDYWDRRNTLRLLGAAVLGISLPSTVSPSLAIRVIGIGDAGCNIVLAAWSSGMLQTDDFPTKFACVTMGQQSSQVISEANQLHSGLAPIREIQLGPFGAGGSVSVARVAALMHDNTLRSLAENVEVVILVAGLGGGTGSGVTPLLASMAKGFGALVMAVLVTPFRWELGRNRTAYQAVKLIERECDDMVSLSNQALAESIGDEALLEVVIAIQELEGKKSLQKLVKSGIRYCRDRRDGSASPPATDISPRIFS